MFLDWPKDNEVSIDASVPISTLSIGARRRFMISDSKSQAKSKQFYVKELCENSILTMKPSLQCTHFHKVERGRSSRQGECGVRYSLTFRRLLPNSVTPPKHPPANVLSDDEHKSCCQSLVFGSSLTAGLKEDLLSKMGENMGQKFKALCKPGARVRTIINKVQDISKNIEVCSNCVENIFVVCRENDTENISLASLIEDLGSLLSKCKD